MRHHFRRPKAIFNKGSLFYSHCDHCIPDQTFEMLLIGFDVKIRSKNLIRV
jgi:hypothetical protein